MTQDEARQKIVAHFDQAFAEAFAGVPVEYENRSTVDREAQSKIGPFVELTVEVTDAEQITMSDPALERCYGMLVVTVSVPLGSGVARQNKIVEWVLAKFGREDLAGVRFKTGRPGKAWDAQGFHTKPTFVPFWFDRETHLL